MLVGCNELLQPLQCEHPHGKSVLFCMRRHQALSFSPWSRQSMLWVRGHLYLKGQCSKEPKSSLAQAQGLAVQGQEWGNPKTSRHRHWQRL